MAMTKQASLSALTLPINAAHPRFMQREMRLVPDDHIICVVVDDGVFMASRIQMEVGQMVGKGTWFSDQCFLHLLYPIIDWRLIEVEPCFVHGFCRLAFFVQFATISPTKGPIQWTLWYVFPSSRSCILHPFGCIASTFTSSRRDLEPFFLSSTHSEITSPHISSAVFLINLGSGISFSTDHILPQGHDIWRVESWYSFSLKVKGSFFPPWS